MKDSKNSINFKEHREKLDLKRKSKEPVPKKGKLKKNVYKIPTGKLPLEIL